MSKALLTIGYGSMMPVLEQSLPSMARYASTHGYDLVVPSGPRPGGDRDAPSWWKIRWIEHLLFGPSQHDEVLWLDADVIVADHAVDIVSELPANEFLGLVVHENATHGQVPNCGVMVWRRDYRSHKLLRQIRSARVPQHLKGLWEQGALMTLMGMDSQRYPMIIPAENPVRFHELGWEWNALPRDWYWTSSQQKDSGARFVHFCGERDHAKLENAIRSHRWE